MLRLAVSIAMFGCAGCVAVEATPSRDRLAALYAALGDPVALQRAAADDPLSQYAYSIALRYGLNGISKAPQLARDYQSRALSAKHRAPITTYMAGLNGAPGRVNIIYIDRHDLDLANLAATERCLAVLDGGARHNPQAAAACGEEYGELQTMWTRAREQTPPK